MIIEIIAVLIGIMLVCAGTYYLIKEKHDAESKKIYTVTLLIGIVIVISALVKIFLMG